MAGLVVKPSRKGFRDQLQQIAITILVFAQQNQMIVAIRIAAGGVALLRDINFAADDRMDALLF